MHIIKNRETIEVTTNKVRGRCGETICKDPSTHGYKCDKCAKFVCNKHCQVTCSSCREMDDSF